MAVTLHGADEGDTETIQETVAEAGERITSVVADTDNNEVVQHVAERTLLSSVWGLPRSSNLHWGHSAVVYEIRLWHTRQRTLRDMRDEQLARSPHRQLGRRLGTHDRDY